MTAITITEALAELKLIDKKIQRKKQAILDVVYRYKHENDPFEKDGGSQKFIDQELQAIKDLYARLVLIRTKIADANLANDITIDKETMCITGWLTWKREVFADYVAVYDDVYDKVIKNVERQKVNPAAHKDEEGNVKMSEMIENIERKTTLEMRESLRETFDKLDGQLSLKNATIVLDI